LPQIEIEIEIEIEVEVEVEVESKIEAEIEIEVAEKMKNASALVFAMRFPICIGLLVIAACSSPLDPNAPAWRRVEGPAPSPRWGTAAVYDATNDRMLLFGGETAQGETNEVWSFDLAKESWARLSTNAGPAPRANPSLVLDARRARLITYGGRTGQITMFADAWSLDLATLTWKQLPSGPGAWQRPHFATNGISAWFYGGEAFGTVSSDLWQFDFATDIWTQLPTDGDGPGARTCGAFAYHDEGLIMVGGHADNGQLDGTFRYDLATHRWSKLSPKGKPTAGAHWAYATDEACGRMFLVAGDHDDHFDTALSDSLALDGSSFAHVPTSTLPPTRDHASIIVDQARRNLILFGGGLNDGESYLGDTWVLPLGACP
jgi:hypothetical protein